MHINRSLNWTDILGQFEERVSGILRVAKVGAGHEMSWSSFKIPSRDIFNPGRNFLKSKSHDSRERVHKAGRNKKNNG